MKYWVPVNEPVILIVAPNRVFNGLTASVAIPPYSSTGIYRLTVKNNRGELIHHSKLVKN